MELWQAYKTIRRRWLLILALMIVGTVIAAAQGVVQKQTWRASATINIGPGTGNDYVASISRVADQLAVLTSRQILTRVDEMLGYNRRLDDYEKAVRGTRVNDSNVMRVDVRWSDPEQARDIANTLADVFIETGSEQIRADAVRELRLLADQLEPARERLRRAQAAVPAGLRADDPNLLAAQEEVAQARQALITVNSKIESARARATNSAAANGMYVVDRAVVPREPEESGGLRTVVFGALMGLFLGMVLAVGMQYLDATPRLLDTLHKELAAPILAVVPWERHFGKGFYPALNKLSQGRREAFRLLRTHLMLQRRTVAPHLHERFATRPLTEPLTVLVVAERPNAGAKSRRL